MMVLRKVWVTTLGWVITLAGVAALVLPGPGLLLLLAGLAILSQEYAWAERRVEPVKRRAFEVAAAGVSTWPRIVFSTSCALFMVGVGVAVWVNPRIPEFWVIGPRLPFGGWTTGLSIVTSALIALALIVYSVWHFRGANRTSENKEDQAESDGQLAR